MNDKKYKHLTPNPPGSFVTNEEFYDAPDYLTGAGSRYSFVTAPEFIESRSHFDDGYIEPNKSAFNNPIYDSDEDDGGFVNMKSSAEVAKQTGNDKDEDEDDFGFRFRPSMPPPRPLMSSSQKVENEASRSTDNTPISPTRNFLFSLEDTLAMKDPSVGQNHGLILETNLDSEFDKSSVGSSYYPQPNKAENRENLAPNFSKDMENIPEHVDNRRHDSESTVSPSASSESSSDDTSTDCTQKRQSPKLPENLKRSSAFWNVNQPDEEIRKIEAPRNFATLPHNMKFKKKAPSRSDRILARLDTDFELESDSVYVETTPKMVEIINNTGTLKHGYNRHTMNNYEDNESEGNFANTSPNLRLSVPELNKRDHEVTLRTKSLNALNFSRNSLCNSGSKSVIIPGPARRASLRRSKLALNNPGSLYSLTLTSDVGLVNPGFDSVHSLDDRPDDVIFPMEQEFQHGPVFASKSDKKIVSPLQRLREFDYKDVNNRKYILAAAAIAFIIIIGIVVIVVLAVTLT